MKSSLFAPAWRSFLYSVAACVMAGLVSLGCSDEPAGSATAGPKTYPYQVTATVGMVADIVRNAAGDKANVTGIMGTGVDPHLYKPTRDDVSSMTRADVVFYAGLLLEGKMSDTLIKVARGKPVYAVTELIDEKFLLEPPEFAGHFDPHVWMDASAWVSFIGRLSAMNWSLGWPVISKTSASPPCRTIPTTLPSLAPA